MSLEGCGFDVQQTFDIIQTLCGHGITLCHFPGWLFQTPFFSHTSYPNSSLVTLGSKSCQGISEKTEAKEFPQFLPPNFRPDLIQVCRFLCPPVPMGDVSPSRLLLQSAVCITVHLMSSRTASLIVFSLYIVNLPYGFVNINI